MISAALMAFMQSKILPFGMSVFVRTATTGRSPFKTRTVATKEMLEYEDYQRKPTIENASEFIFCALEQNLDIAATRKNYVDYLAHRPRVEKIGEHGPRTPATRTATAWKWTASAFIMVVFLRSTASAFPSPADTRWL